MKVIIVRKHLQGQHDQSTHGNHGTSSKVAVSYEQKGNTLFVQAHRSEEFKKSSWIESAMPDEAVASATVGLPTKDQPYAYVEQVNAHRKGYGFGYETMKDIFSELKKRGVKEVRAYVVNTNYEPVSMNKKLGGKIIENKPEGYIWQWLL